MFKDKAKRTADSEFEGQRIKRCKLGQGAHRKIDDTEEEFLREIVEQDRTSHGCRHDEVGYMSKGKKLEDLYQALDEKRKAKGRPLIKSMTTVYNRAKPRREGSRQAKKRIGKSYFCWKTPPKPLKNLFSAKYITDPT